MHESLSREPGDDIAFIEIVRPLLRLAEEGLQSPDRPVRFTVTGDGGRIPSNTATPLSVVLTELLRLAWVPQLPGHTALLIVTALLTLASGLNYVLIWSQRARRELAERRHLKESTHGR